MRHNRIPDQYYRLESQRVLNRAAAGVRPPDLFADIDDELWLWLHTEGVRQSPELGGVLPGLPDEHTQQQTVGLAGDRALEDGFAIYRLVKGIFQGRRGRVGSCRRILDFGCGWGRVTRFFLRDIEPERVWGVDHWDKMVEICRQTNRWNNFSLVKPQGPTEFEDGSFDLIWSYSVFSHLSEIAHRAWVDEFARLLSPGGVLIATTWDRELIARCAALRRQEGLPFFQTHLPTMFSDTERWLQAYDAGQYCFDTSVESYGLVSSYLGETCIPRQYVLEHWNSRLRLVDYIDDRNVCPQNVIVAIRRDE